MIVGLGLAVLLLLSLGVYLVMKFRRRRRVDHDEGHKVYRGSSARPAGSGEDDAEDDHASERQKASDHGRRRYKYRVRRRTHRSRNPTLAETGGLPPSKTSEPAQPS
jgi:hypothetical protein